MQKKKGGGGFTLRLRLCLDLQQKSDCFPNSIADIPIRFLKMQISLDALAAQIVFCVSLTTTQNDNVKTGDGNAGSIHPTYRGGKHPDIYTSQSFSCAR